MFAFYDESMAVIHSPGIDLYDSPHDALGHRFPPGLPVKCVPWDTCCDKLPKMDHMKTRVVLTRGHYVRPK